MKRLFIPLIGFMLLGSQAKTQNLKYQNTVKIDPNDSKEVIIEKAAHVVPSINQLNALRNEFIAFIHFGPNTFTRMEWGNGMENPQIFNLKNLDTNQWCESIKAAGMKMVILTVKHHDGFVLWQSRYTQHGIMSTAFENGQGDILKSLSASCLKYGLKLGVYLSPADLYQIENPKGLYGNLSAYSKRTIPKEIKGRPFKNKTKFEFEVDDYNEYFLNQLFEILTEYGPIHEVWFDGAHPKTKGGQKYNYKAWKKLIKTLAPQAVVFGREDIRWCGNESGATRSTEWNVIPFAQNPDSILSFPDLTGKDLASRDKLYKGKYLHYQQAETNTSIREGWFYRDDTHQKVRSADDIFDIYERAVGGNSTFLLNIPPNREGQFSPKDVESLKEVGKRIKETYGVNLFKGAKGPKKILDNNLDTYIKINANNPEIIITTPQPITLNRLVIQEAIHARGERVEKHTIEAWLNGAWKEIANATNIGHKRILRFPEVTTNRVKVRFLESRSTPAICNVSAHHYQTRPPQLSCKRNLDGMVTIAPMRQDFNWKSHGEDVAGNLNAGYIIYYTTDGTEPNEMSIEYKKPFLMNNGEVKAISILNKQKGTILHERIGYIKKNWKVIGVSSESKNKAAALAFDENNKSFWLSNEQQTPHYIDLDLSQEENLKGFAYTPQNQNSNGMIAKGIIKISHDGKTWHDTEIFEFGNLINDPSKRYHYFKNEIKARYLRIETTEIAAGGNVAAVAELDFF